jgi:large subunit ribosomal protein L5
MDSKRKQARRGNGMSEETTAQQAPAEAKRLASALKTEVVAGEETEIQRPVSAVPAEPAAGKSEAEVKTAVEKPKETVPAQPKAETKPATIEKPAVPEKKKAEPDSKEQNIMRKIRIAKITLNMGVGETGEELKKATRILEKVAGRKPVQTKSKVKIPAWGLREGKPIGIKVTLRKEEARAFLENALKAKENELRKKNFDKNGNVGFGIKEYIDLPGTKYDPQLGIRGLDVLVTIERPGYRIKNRKLRPQKVGNKHRITRDESIAFIQENFGVKVK